MKTREPFVIKDVGSQVADRLTVILGINGLLIEGAFGPLSLRQKQAMVEMLQTTEELITLLEPALRDGARPAGPAKGGPGVLLGRHSRTSAGGGALPVASGR